MGGVEPDLPAARQWPRRHAHAVVVRPADRADLQAALPAAPAGAPAAHQAVEERRAHRRPGDATAVVAVPGRPGRLGPGPGVAARPRPARGPVVEEGATSRSVYLPEGCW